MIDNVVAIDDQETEGDGVVYTNIMDRIEDSLDVEHRWRKQGRTVQQIYRGIADSYGEVSPTRLRYNIFNANVSVLLPSLFAKTPKPDIRARSKMPSFQERQVAEALEKTCEVLLDDTMVYEHMKKAVKEVLLAGRGTCRVRWNPIITETPVVDMMGQPVRDENGQQATQLDKLLDTIEIEHVYWEDYTHEAVSDWSKVGWVAYRHLFTQKEFEEHFGNAKAYQSIVANGQSHKVFQYTDRTAYQSKGDTPRNSGEGFAKERLQDKIQKAVVWEYWDKSTREVIWICKECGHRPLAIHKDPLELEGFFPSPKPLLAVTTTDALIPTPEFVIYQDLAKEMDATSDRIAAIVERIKVRGAYNASVEGLENILKNADGVMEAVQGMDLAEGLDKAVWFQDNADNIAALQQLYQSRQQSKEAMYEITGISDIVRGQTRASETLGAQRMKSAFAQLRIQDRKDSVEHFCRDLIRIMCEIMATHWDEQSFMYIAGVQLDPGSMQLLREDGLRISRIDVETDSTIAEDQAEQVEDMGQMMQSLAMGMQNLLPIVQQGIMPIEVAVAFMKMMIKPFKGARQVQDLMDRYLMQLQQMGPQAPAAPQGERDGAQEQG